MCLMLYILHKIVKLLSVTFNYCKLFIVFRVHTDPKCSWIWIRYLTLSDFRTDKSVRKWRPAVTFVRTLRSKYGALTGVYPALYGITSAHEVFTCFWLQAAIASAYLPVGRKWSSLEVCRCFLRVFESYDCRTKFKFINWHGKQQPTVWNFCCESEVSG